jgi:hypothetical protein
LDLCNSLLVVDPVVWPPVDTEINITEAMCRRYHEAYIIAGEEAGAVIRAEASAWSEITRSEAWEYSVRIRAEADAYKASIQLEMQAWRLEYIAQIKLDITNRHIIEIVTAEDDAARELANLIIELRAKMELEIRTLQAYYDGQILIIKNNGDDLIGKTTIEIDLHVKTTIENYRITSNILIGEGKS